MTTVPQPTPSGAIRSAVPARGGKGAQAYLDQLRRLGASEQEVDAAREAGRRRSRLALLRRR